MSKVNERHTLILYTTAVCDLNCTYCYIDKNPALVKIDNILDESFNGDYYFNFSKEMFPDRYQLNEMQFWGGEPTLRLDRAFYTIKKCLDYYPNLHRFMFSTNMVGAGWIKQIEDFCNLFREYEPRKFEIVIQMSIDGPTKINDAGRGKGTTEKFTKNFINLINLIKDRKVPENVSIMTNMKATLSNETIPLLQTKEAILNYYQFFENFAQVAKTVEEDNYFIFDLPVPNMACPSPVTKEIGLQFANLCRLTREIEKENFETGHSLLKYYNDITPFSIGGYKKWACPDCLEHYGMCGMGLQSIGLLPNDCLSFCHNGFVDLLADYKLKSNQAVEENNHHSIDKELFSRNLETRNTNCKKEDYEVWENILLAFESENTSAQFLNYVSLIIYLSKNNLIDSKYSELNKAMDAAHFILTHTAYCIRDNIGSNGSSVIPCMGTIKLLLNGAKEYIENR